MIVGYILFGILFLIALLCCFAPFFKAGLNKQYDKELDELSSHSRLKRASKYRCIHCYGKLRLSDDKTFLHCRDCTRSYHPDFLLTFYGEDG